MGERAFSFYKQIVSPVLDRMDSETMHHFAVEVLHFLEFTYLSRELISYSGNSRSLDFGNKLETSIAGIKLDSPVMVGAGWDKNGRAVQALHLLGFSGVEIGCVVENPQYGNPKPRQFVISPGVAINRKGFDSKGMEVVARNLDRYRHKDLTVGINIGKNESVPIKDAPRAYATVAAKLCGYAKYFTINVSCPNTPGVLHLQNKEILQDIICSVREAIQICGELKPIFIKIAPDLSNSAINDVIRVVVDNNADGIVATNTTPREDLKAKYGDRWKHEAGGLSGDDEDFRRMSTGCVAHIYRETGGALPIIGIGGVMNGKTALEKIKAGATAIQVVTGMRGEGATVAGKIKYELFQWMQNRGVKSLQEIVGCEASAFRRCEHF